MLLLRFRYSTNTWPIRNAASYGNWQFKTGQVPVREVFVKISCCCVISAYLGIDYAVDGQRLTQTHVAICFADRSAHTGAWAVTSKMTFASTRTIRLLLESATSRRQSIDIPCVDSTACAPQSVRRANTCPLFVILLVNLMTKSYGPKY